METLLVQESLVSRFKFWMSDRVQNGIQLRNELFCYISRFDSHQRQQAFDSAWTLSRQGRPSIITVSNTHYTVWASLRSPEHPHVHPEPALAVLIHENSA